MTWERTPSRMLLMRGFSVCCDNGEQRFLERQAGTHQRRELPGDQRQVGGGHAACDADAEALLAARFVLGDLGDVERQELALAQQLADLARRVALDDALAFAAGGVDAPCIRMRPTVSLRASPARQRAGAGRTRSVLARDTQDLFERGDRPRGPCARPSSRMLGLDGARVALQLVLAGAVVNHRAHLVVDVTSS